MPQTSLEESREIPVIEEATDQDENTEDVQKRALGRKKQSIEDVSLELAKLHVSYKHENYTQNYILKSNAMISQVRSINPTVNRLNISYIYDLICPRPPIIH